MEDIQLLVDLYKKNSRLGPGSDEHTRQALRLADLGDATDLAVADLGCGTGASALVLAEELAAPITAVDLFPEFLEELTRRARQQGVDDKITPLKASIDNLPFAPESLDMIWAEGAIYNIGFEAGIRAWRPLLAPGGILAVSEITWLGADRPDALQRYWEEAYPEIDRASAKFAILEEQGFRPRGYFYLPRSCWVDNYYRPLEQRFPSFLADQDHSEAAQAMVAEQKEEMELYEQFGDHFSYGFYIAQKVAD